VSIEPHKHGVAARRPGQYGRTVIRRNLLRWLAVVAGLIALQVVVILVTGAPGPTFIAVELAVIASVVLVDRSATRGFDRRTHGVEAEKKVGEILESLAPRGWLAVHDVATGRGNIDHIAIGPAGVFTVETKSYRGRISSSRIPRQWLAQAYAERKALEELAGVQAQCLLVLSDAYIVGKPVVRQRGVVILPARMLANHLDRRERVLTPEKIEACYAQVVSAFDGR
jgi:hypothetical protein